MDRFLIDDRYLVDEKAKNIGGFGTIHLGFDKRLDRKVAIKQIKSDLANDNNALKMFTDEARTIARFNFPTIVTIYDQRIAADGRIFIIMEYIDGLDVRTLLQLYTKQQQRLPVALGVYIISEVCDALEYAHTRLDHNNQVPLNIIHRDISPSNIMVTSEGHVKVIDFGIAKTRFRTCANTKSGFKGNPPYMSPEQVDEHSTIDHRSDIFSLGSVMYEIITGEQLFGGEIQREITNLIAEVVISPSRFEKPFIPEEIKKIILSAVKKNPEERYPSAKAMNNDLQLFLRTTTSINQRLELKGIVNSFLPGVFPPGTDDTRTQVGSVKNVQTQALILPSTNNEPDQKWITQIIKAIYNFILIFSAKLNRQRLFKGLFVILCLLVLSKLVVKYYPSDGIVPRYDAFSINSFPEGAQIELDGKQLPDKTPLKTKIKPGEHTLKLSLKGFIPVEKTINIVQNSSKELSFPFRALVYLESIQPGAGAVIDDVVKKIPYYDSLEINRNYNIQMFSGKFDTIQILLQKEFFTSEPVLNNTWKFEKRIGDIDTFCLKGLFFRSVFLQTAPPRAEIYIEGEDTLRGLTNVNYINLLSGTHQIRLKKEGFLEKTIQLEIDDNTTSQPPLYYLSRGIQISVRSLSRTQSDLRASIIKLDDRNIREKITPARMDLDYRTHRLFICKEGYLDTIVVIERDEVEKMIVMKQQPPGFKVKLVDEQTNKPIYNGIICFKMTDTDEREKIFGKVNSNGSFSRQIVPGKYSFRVVSENYRGLPREILINQNNKNSSVTLRLTRFSNTN